LARNFYLGAQRQAARFFRQASVKAQVVKLAGYHTLQQRSNFGNGSVYTLPFSSVLSSASRIAPFLYIITKTGCLENAFRANQLAACIFTTENKRRAHCNILVGRLGRCGARYATSQNWVLKEHRLSAASISKQSGRLLGGQLKIASTKMFSTDSKKRML